MTLKKSAVQDEESYSDSTQFSRFSLQKLKERKTIIKAKEDSSQVATGILVVDLKGKITSLNKRFISMWNLSREIVSLQNDWQAIKLVSTQFQDPAFFLKEVEKIYEQIDFKIYDSVKLKDGRIFKRITKPQWSNGVIVGRIWLFRQII